MEGYIRELEMSASESDSASERLLELVRDFHLQLEVARNRENQLADEAKEMGRVWVPAEDKVEVERFSRHVDPRSHLASEEPHVK